MGRRDVLHGHDCDKDPSYQLDTLPVVQLSEPKQTLPDDAARHLAERMREILSYQYSDHIYKTEVLRMLYDIFLLDLQNLQDQTIVRRHLSQRVEEIFIGFIRLVPDNYMLLTEASFLLRTSKLSIAQISDRLHFADTPSFSKFFSRMKGLSPREYRES